MAIEVASQPKHPRYSVETVRLSSFSKWPPTSPQIPSVLCDAGFFYAGFSDCVRCFCCGGGLRNWEDGDIAWIEHARWYPNCEFLHQRKGEMFVQMHRHTFQRHEELPDPEIFQGRASSDSQLEQTQRQELHREDDSNKETERRQTAIRSVIEMGYQQSVVDTCVEKLIARGKAKITATDIMELIFETEDRGTESQSQTAQASASRPSTSQEQNGLSETPWHLPSTSVDCRSLVKEIRDLKEQMVCKICLDKDACMVYLPCGHMVTCQQCAPTIRKCCICRQLIQGTVRAYL